MDYIFNESDLQCDQVLDQLETDLICECLHIEEDEYFNTFDHFNLKNDPEVNRYFKQVE